MFSRNDKASGKFQYAPHKNIIKALSTPKNLTKEIPNTNTDWILLGWQVAGLDNKKDYAALEVIDSLLGTGMSSRLFKNLRDQEGLAYQLGSSYSANALSGAFLVYIGTNPDTYEQSLKGLWKEINTLKTEFVGTKELQEAKDKLIGHFVISLETNMDKADNLAWHQAAEDNYKFAKEYEQLINSVTESDIMRTANKYFGQNNYILSVVKKK
jgi:predicted Zn-dependent peptidase